MRKWLVIALDKAVVHRALKMALLVGIVLAAINHGDAIVNGALTAVQAVKIVVTFFVPYCVSTISSVAAIRQSRDTQK